MNWLQNPNQKNADNLNNVRCEASRHFRNKKVYLKAKIDKLETNSEIKNMFENRMLRTVFGPKRDEVTGEWRKLHNEDLNDLYSSPNTVRLIKSRRMRWVGHLSRMGRRCVFSVLVGKPEGKRPLGKPRRKWRII